jgi:hypothetical protein
MALKIEDIIEALREEKIPAPTIIAVQNKLEAIQEELKAERKSDVPKAKNEYVIVVRGDASLAAILQQGWVIQVPFGSDIQNIRSKFTDAAKEHNTNQKRKKNIVQKWSEFFQYCKRPFVKSRGINIKTKQAVQVVVLDKEGI